VINAVVAADGTFIVNETPAGASLTVARTEQGAYQVTISGLGDGCPLPIANAFAATFMFLNGGSCGSGSLTTLVETGDGLDHPFGFSASSGGLNPAPASSNANVASESTSSGVLSLPDAVAK
jgi:hypothetical protein